MKNLPDPLPDNEWRFDAYKSDFAVTQAFYYEYCRSCTAVHKLIIGGRRYFGTLSGRREEVTLDLTREEYSASIKKLPCYPIFRMLSAIPEFPEKPLRNVPDLSIYLNVLGVHTSPIGLTSYDIPSYLSNWMWKMPEQVSEDCFSDPLYGPTHFGKTTLSLLSIHWGLSDKELLQDFRDFLKKNRPESEKDRCDSDVRGITGESLPFKKSVALNWLSIWRRKEAALITWDEYVALYHPEYDNPTNRRHGKRDALVRRLKFQKSQAERVLGWFAGKPWKPVRKKRVKTGER